MDRIKIKTDKVSGIISQETIDSYREQIDFHNESIHDKTGKGNDFLGWVDLPSSTEDSLLTELERTVEEVKKDIDLLIVVGIGGSYLGAKALIEAKSHSFNQLMGKQLPHVLFAGHQISEDYMSELLELLDNKSYAVVVISKSGTTTEPALAFRFLKSHLEMKEGKEKARKKIIAITDKSKGALRSLADREGYKSFVISDDIGGRYSVLSPVGLLPAAFAGIDLRQLMAGARDAEKFCGLDQPFDENPAAIYAAVRNALYQRGKTVEIMVNYHPKLHFFTEWWKQLYGESEGKEGNGIFPAGVDFTTDLHSMGQYIQDGQRVIFETVISIIKPERELVIIEDKDNLDKLNFLSGKRMDEVNKMAELGTQMAHVEGGVPNIVIEVPQLTEYYMGQLIYFFEKACAISGYILGVNPFDQPGVEAYKKKMFELLGKPE